MCTAWFKKKFQTKPILWPHSNKVALLFGINDYGGNGDLKGCINDIDLVAEKLYDFQIRRFADAEVTVKRFIAEVEYALLNAVSGDTIYIHYSGHGTYVKDYNGDELDGYDEALYLRDGALVDDKLNEILQKTPDGVIVALFLDSCFSGTATRKSVKDERIRFIPPNFDIDKHLQVKRGLYDNLKWIVISACAENQTAADAFINGRYHGAFTYYAMNNLRGYQTFQEWFNSIRAYLPNTYFDQEPTIEGNESLINKMVLI